MSEKLENTANEALKLIVENAAAAKEFILSELPEVVQQLLMWKLADSIISNIIALAILCYLMFFSLWIYKNRTGFNYDGWICKANLEPMIIIPFAASFLIGPIVMSFYFNSLWLKIWIAPKVYLLEYAAKLL